MYISFASYGGFYARYSDFGIFQKTGIIMGTKENVFEQLSEVMK